MSRRRPAASWQEQNREFLALAIDDLHARMEGEEGRDEGLAELSAQMTHAPTAVTLFDAFDLDPFERDVVLLCLAAELDPRFRDDGPRVTVGYALEALEGAHWSGLDAAGPLREWGIVETPTDVPLADRPLRLAEDVLRYAMGFDPRLGGDGLFGLVPPPPVFVDSQLRAAGELATVVVGTAEVTGRTAAVELHGATEADRLAFAVACGGALDVSIAAADVRDLPAPGPELDAVLRFWDRCGVLTATVLCLTGADERDADPAIRHRLDRALERVRRPLFVSTARPTVFEPVRPLLRREVLPLTAAERREVWAVCVKEARSRLPGRRTRGLAQELATLAADFRFDARTIERVCLETATLRGDADGEEGDVDPLRLARLLRHGCARAVRARLDPLADRVTVGAAVDVVLPAEQARQLEELETHVRLAEQVTASWGVGRDAKSSQTALFAGPSGTGKTHAALALARRLRLDLYRVDISSVMSKWIGETEKNLDAIFDAAEIGGAILLFDEADALFGKRSEVRDSHDRYANIGTAYLLQRIERAATPTVLTTNIKEAIDPAFTRRLHFVVDFPFPGEAEREEIWSTIYPEETPVGRLAPERLAKLVVTGGTISNIARRGAFLAAAEASDVEMRHLRESTLRELRKIDRDMSPEELAAWR